MMHGALQDFALTLDKFLDHAAKWHPETEVVTAREDGSTARIGYAGLNLRARQVSGALRSLGVAQGDRVATLAWNTQEHMEAWYGIMAMGAVCHTLNPRLTAEQLAWMIDRSGAKLLLASADLAELAHSVSDLSDGGSCRVMILGPEAKGPDAFDAVANLAPQDTPWGEFNETSPCGLCFTSGTTGAPKGVTYTHRGNYLHTLKLMQADVTAITARDVVMPVVPMFHANAWGLPFACPAAGAGLVLPGRQADGESLARLIAQEGVTIAVGVPTVWLGLMDYLDATGTTLPSLKRIMVGGAPMAQALMDRIEARGIAVQTTWGMTELSPLGTATPPNSEVRDPRAAGRPAVGVDLRLTDETGTPLPRQRDVEGYLWVRGPAVVERYFGQEESATVDGWFDTGDLARIDHYGTVRITGRSKDLIKSGGEWINPGEIETIISALPCVAQSAVIGRSDPKWGERPLLLVEFREGFSPSDEDLLAELKGKVANWWIPQEVVRLRAMPLAPTGKIDKLRLRNQYCRA
ncbi:long-chain-fatty-acid--CoA ligase [Qipengyuania sp. JC766]|uniref:long-chain-fatty-acid--CoA ligase n=1 Tax=Qipengyuania sp. JC766 TaxID=3232139 RepID=UPI0034599A8E